MKINDSFTSTFEIGFLPICGNRTQINDHNITPICLHNTLKPINSNIVAAYIKSIILNVNYLSEGHFAFDKWETPMLPIAL
jgi:hypothetical protein